MEKLCYVGLICLAMLYYAYCAIISQLYVTKFRKQKMKKEKILNAAKSVGRDEGVSYDI